MVQKVSAQSMRTFMVIWIGQFVSLIGSGLTGFALGVWVYMETGSVTPLALIALFSTVPHLVVAPFAGALVDRWDRRTAMILSDSGAAACTAVIAVLLFMDNLEIWHIYVVAFASSSFSTFQWPAYSAATTLLVPKRHLARASGMVQTAESASQILSPIIAGLLIVTIRIWGVLVIDFASFLFALVTLLFIRIPQPEPTADGQQGKGSLFHEVMFGWSYIRARPGLLALLLFFAGINLSGSATGVLFTPLVLSFSSPVVLGTIQSAGGVGMLLGGLFLSVWGGPRRRVYGVLGFGFLGGAATTFLGIQPSALIIAVAGFASLFTIPITNGCSQAIWQTKTAPDVQGKVFSIRRAIAWSTTPVSFLLVGPLADNMFEPLMAVNGSLAGSVGKIIGTGPGRGIGLMFIIIGVLMMVVAGVCYLYPRLRYVEDELPDMVAEESDEH
jgi:DHA3 family macrolide efflux protein-like MFS transporter